MTLSELIAELRRIVLVHPEAAQAHLWAYDADGNRFRVRVVGFNRKNKPPRVKLEE
jgi:hypothetical protein